MLSGIRQFFEKNLKSHSPENPVTDELAIACLLAEVIFADNEFDEKEWHTFIARLKLSFEMSDSELNELAETAKNQVKQASDLFQFTHVVKAMEYDKRVQLIEGLWQIAYADGNLDPHEEHIIRRICELIGLGHSDFIKTKLAQAN
ncbi:TerB family tellurite resistance protein [Catenovulum sp. 2E275]|uniref:tellurite resistance TerB family protein n=1 Tax=Catenovulum sp. 2E275 TaxID=2980497 RepID=UPI0021D253D0|nr:TerB family tellurite resistance protein [Catenovulum sp. 2E275]MCU4676132.1 TerB family tellurite resistance protein [Catenovulum sp. 2E275]